MSRQLESYNIKAEFASVKKADNFVAAFEALGISFGSIMPTKGLTNEPTESTIYISNVNCGDPIGKDMRDTLTLIKLANGKGTVISKE